MVQKWKSNFLKLPKLKRKKRNELELNKKGNKVKVLE